MARVIVGVLRGGNSSEYEFSLKSGSMAISALPEERYDVRDIFIDKRGNWYWRGKNTSPAYILSHIDVALNALHGGIGEDGSIAKIVALSGVPYVGSSIHTAPVSLNKIRAREVFREAGLRIPRGVSFVTSGGIGASDMARTVFAEFGPPYVVKPPTEGSSHGILIANSILELPHHIADILDNYGSVLIEEFIQGQEATVCIIENFRNIELYALPPATVRYNGGKIISRDMYDRQSVNYISPSNFSYKEKKDMEDMARNAHKSLGLSHSSQSDILLTKRGPYLLETNSSPHLHTASALPVMLESVGSSMPEYLQHVIELARR